MWAESIIKSDKRVKWSRSNSPKRSKNHGFQGLLASGSVSCLSNEVSALPQIYIYMRWCRFGSDSFIRTALGLPKEER